MKFTPETDLMGDCYHDELGSRYDRLEDGYVGFGNVAGIFCYQQSQYTSRYVEGRIEGYPALGQGLRFSGDPMDYHELGIHPDDVEEFVLRYNAYGAAFDGRVVDRIDGPRQASLLEASLGRAYLKLALGIEA